VTCELNSLINLIGHIWHPYFSEHTGIAECVRVSKNLQSNSQQQNNLRPELFWGMSGVDLKITTIRDSGISGYKSERFTGKTRFFLGWTCYTCENTSLFSRKSRVLHTFEVCAPTGVYKRKGGPRSSHYFAFQKYCRQLMCMEMEILLVFIPGILSKRCLHKCYTGSWTRKTLRQPKGLTTIYFQQVDNFIGVSSYLEGGIMRRIRMKCQKAISILIDTCRAAISWKISSAIFLFNK